MNILSVMLVLCCVGEEASKMDVEEASKIDVDWLLFPISGKWTQTPARHYSTNAHVSCLVIGKCLISL